MTSPTAAYLKSREWTKADFYVTTNHKKIPLGKLNDTFASTTCYWAKALPLAVLEETLQHSLCFGLFHRVVEKNASTDPSNQDSFAGELPVEEVLVGFARCVTDFTTFSYLTDVWIDPAYQGKGLGTWLLTCVRTCTDSMPHLRRSLLFTGDWDRSVPLYENMLGMTVSAGEKGVGLAVMERKGPGHPSFGSDGHGYH